MKARLGLTMLLLAAAMGAIAATPAAPAAAAPASVEAGHGVGALIAEVGRIGQKATLPPHLVDVLGLGTHFGGLAVRQLSTRHGSEVRAFNVSVENRRDIVIFNYDEATKVSLVFLLTPTAKLRRAVTFLAGGESRALAAPEARRRFATELDYWLAILRSGSPVSR
jgi:hypothetical protein